MALLVPGRHLDALAKKKKEKMEEKKKAVERLHATGLVLRRMLRYRLPVRGRGEP